MREPLWNGYMIIGTTILKYMNDRWLGSGDYRISGGR